MHATPREASSHRVLPDGCIDLLFDFSGAGEPRASVIGTMTRALVVATTGSVDLLGVRFRPGGLSGILRFDAAELTDARVDLANFLGREALGLWHRLNEATPANRAQVLREELGARTGGAFQVDPFIRHCVSRIEAARGGLHIRDLEKSTGLSVRQLERKFVRHLGIGPKRFAQIVRFKAVAAAASVAGQPDWAGLAGDFGFSDQAHLVREFGTFSGLTPTDYLGSTDDPARDVGFLQDVRLDFG